MVSGFLVPGVWCFPILREYLGTLCRGTAAHLFRVKRGFVGAPGTVVAVVPGCAVPGSVVDWNPPLAGSAGVQVCATYPAPLGMGKCAFWVQPNFVVSMELGVDSRGMRVIGFLGVLTCG